MKKLITLAFLLVTVTAFAQDPVTKYLQKRFGGEEKTVFMPKGSHALGIKGGFRSFNVVGDDATNQGYTLLSMLNIGEGKLRIWNVSPSYSSFLKDDLALVVALHYTGYSVNSDLRLDLREIVNSTNDALNFTLSNRLMQHHSLGASVALRKYVPLFGSKSIAVFGEGRFETSYGATSNSPRDKEDKTFLRDRMSGVFTLALKAGGGVAVKLKDNSAVTVSVPLFGLAYSYSKQNKITTEVITEEKPDPADPQKTIPVQTVNQINSTTHMSSFNATRSVDFLGVQIGYTRFIEPKRKR